MFIGETLAFFCNYPLLVTVLLIESKRIKSICSDQHFRVDSRLLIDRYLQKAGNEGSAVQDIGSFLPRELFGSPLIVLMGFTFEDLICAR